MKKASSRKTKLSSSPSHTALGSNIVWNQFGQRYVVLPMRECSSWKQIAESDKSILITGETGTGKEEFVNLLVAHGKRDPKKYFSLNCAGLADNLIASELFGYEKGAFTGADITKTGRLAMLDGGTVFLDEIGELSTHLQAVLLRFLQSGEIQPVGSTKTNPLKVDVRIIAATNVKKDNPEHFRQDLRHRFDAEVSLPALRERPEDIIHFLVIFFLPFDVFTGITLQCLLALHAYQWPGNIRELHKMCERVKQPDASSSISDQTQQDYVLRTLADAEKRGFHQGIFDLMDRLLAYYEIHCPRDAAHDSVWLSPLTMNTLRLFAHLRRRASVYREKNPEFPPELIASGYHHELPLARLIEPESLPRCYDFTVFKEIFMLNTSYMVLDLREAMIALGGILGQRNHLAIEQFSQHQEAAELKSRMLHRRLNFDQLAEQHVTAVDYGLVTPPQKIQLAEILDKLSSTDRKICELKSAGKSVRAVASELHLGKTTVQDILNKLKIDHPALQKYLSQSSQAGSK